MINRFIKKKKIIALILLFLTIFSIIQPVLAAAGTGKFVGGQFASQMKTTDNNKPDGILIRRLSNQTTGKTYTVFCTEHGTEFITGTVYNGQYYTPTNEQMKKAAKVAYFGWYKERGDYVVNGGISDEWALPIKKAYVYTQQYLWEVLDQSHATFLDAGYQNEYVEFKNNIENQINNMKLRPSFDGTEIEIKAGETKTIIDSNNVLQNYNTINQTREGIRFEHTFGENTMRITVPEDCKIERLSLSDATMKEWGMIKNGSEDHDTTMYFTFNNANVQNQLYSLNYNDPVTLSFDLKINLFGRLELSKLDKNGTLIDGSVFNVTGPDNFNKDVKVSGGKIVLEELKPGVYSVREKTSPKGYLLDTKTYNVEVKTNQTASQAIVNEKPTGTFTLTKYNSDKSATVANVKFRFWNNNGYDKTLKTDQDGKITITGLELGEYFYQELETVSGYLIDDTVYSFNLTYKDPYTSIIYGNADLINYEPFGEIKLEKTDVKTGNQNRVDGDSHHGDASIENSVVTLYAKEDIYNVAKTIKYFSKDESIATFTFNKYGVATIKIINNQTKAPLSIEGDVLKGLPMGKFYGKETTIPLGYKPNETIYNYTLSYKDSRTSVIMTGGTILNDIVKAPFEVIKISTNSNTVASLVANAEFTAILTKYVDYYGSFEEALKHLDEYADDEYSIFRTDSTGHGVSRRLAFGNYTVNETFVPNSKVEKVEEFYVTIDRDSNTPIKELVANDGPFESYIKIQKKDKETGKLVTYSNATFSLSKLNEETKKWEAVQCKVGNQYFDTWTTDSNGIARTENKLSTGTYRIEDEIKVPDGFVKFDGDIIFEVNNKNKTLEYDKDLDAWITVTVENEQPKGKINLTKKINLRNDADKTLIKDIDYTQIAFKLVAKEDIIDYSDGSIIYKKDKEIGRYNLSADKTLTIDNLPLGSYYMQEIATIKGAVLNDTKYDVVFTQTDTTTKKYTVDLNIENDTTLVEVSKQDITGEKEVTGAKLKVIDENNNVVDSWISSSESHKIEGLEVDKTYTLVEEIPAEGYVKATEIKFSVKNTGEVQKVVMIDKVVEVLKVDKDGKPIVGAKLKVINKNGDLLDSWTTDGKVHRVSGLEEGKTYVLHEEISADGFVIAKEIEFTVTKDKQTQRIVMTDKIVQVLKTDKDGNIIEGAKLQVLDKKNNVIDEWVTTKEPHRVKNLKEGETYVLHEEISVDGYVKATDVEFLVTENKQTQTITMIDKIVEMSKVDIAGNEIEGAKLQVFDLDGNLLDEWVSEINPHKIKNLEENKEYILHEEIAAEGFVKATDIKFKVTDDKETQKIEMIDKIVEVSKTDLVTSEELPGAELEITDKDGNIIDKWTSTTETHIVKGLEEGKEYKLTETNCPYCYEQAESITFTVTEEKENQLIEMKDMPILKTIKVVKIDADTKEKITGDFSFGIFEDFECTKLIKEVQSDKEDSTVTFEDLRYGVFFIKELKAPENYQLSDKIVVLVISDDGVFADDVLLEDVDSVCAFEFENKQIPEIQTGNETNYPMIIMSIVLSILCMIICFVILAKKNRK